MRWYARSARTFVHAILKISALRCFSESKVSGSSLPSTPYFRPPRWRAYRRLRVYPICKNSRHMSMPTKSLARRYERNSIKIARALALANCGVRNRHMGRRACVYGGVVRTPCSPRPTRYTESDWRPTVGKRYGSPKVDAETPTRVSLAARFATPCVPAARALHMDSGGKRMNDGSASVAPPNAYYGRASSKNR